MAFVAGCCVVGLAWILSADDQQAAINPVVINEIIPEETAFEGTLSFDDWVNDVSQLNNASVVALHLAGDASHDLAQAILIRDDGHLITSAHAITGAEDITAEFLGGTLPAQVIGVDEVSGIAVLKINSPDLPPPTFSDESQVLVSDRLVALSHSTNEREPAKAIDVNGTGHVAVLANGDLLSGLLRLSDDLTGDWTGSAILSEDGGIVAMAVTARDDHSYAIPIAAARQAANQLITDGTVDHKSWLGIVRAPITDDLKEQRDVLGGLLLTRVWPETPAARAGLVAGDVIIQAGSVNVIDRTDLLEALAALEPGDAMEITYSRTTSQSNGSIGEPSSFENEILTTTVILGARPA